MIASPDSAQIASLEQTVRRLEMRLLRQTKARQEAENLLEDKSLALYRVNESLRRLTNDLEDEVAKQTKELTIALVQANSARMAKDEFLANLSHEVRTPLNAIMGLTQVLLRTDLADEQKNYLNLLDSSAVNLMILLNDVLDFSKIESGKLSFHNVPFDFYHWLKQTVDPYTIQAENKGLSLTTHCAEALPHVVVGDPHRLRQILTNLLTNALKFTPSGEISVRVDLAQDTIALSENEIGLTFTVSDTGIGVPIEKQQRIFDAFMQADTSITRTYGGTGLGLTICERLVASMKGRIAVSSQPGEGSRFEFNIVLERAPNALNVTPSEQPVRERPLSGLKVLLVEDNLINQLLMRKMLEQFGAEIIIANNGLIATQSVLQHTFDLIFMDMQMPVMGGLEATALIRQQEATSTKRTPIIALTANAMQGDKEACLQAGMDAYASKPVSEAELFLAIESALATKR